MGDVDKEPLVPSVEDGDGPDPVDVASRVVAHLGHRVPFVRKIEKRLEGKDKTSGILSDIGALALQLYAKNEDEIKNMVKTILEQRAGKVVQKPAEPVAHDFGEVSPNGQYANNNGGGI